MGVIQLVTHVLEHTITVHPVRNILYIDSTTPQLASRIAQLHIQQLTTNA